MRTYIFTSHERKVIDAFLKGIEEKDMTKVRHRMKRFKELSGDVDLYLKLKAALGI